MRVKVDIHNHSCLSACGSLEMSPRRLVREAEQRGINMLALTDHNSGRNLPAFRDCCLEHGIFPLYGMEITSIEEAHVVGIFEDMETALDMGCFVESRLPPAGPRAFTYGDMVYVDRYEKILGYCDRALFTATDLSIDRIVEEVHYRSGIVFPAHIDRAAFSIVMQLGFLPDLPYDAVECLDPHYKIDTLGYRPITNSDAHYPEQVGRRSTTYELSDISWGSLLAALELRRFSPPEKF